MKAARLGRTPAHDKGAPRVLQFPRAIRKSASGMLSAAAQLLLLIRVALPL